MMNMLILFGKCILVFQREDKLPFCSDEQQPFLFNSHFNFVFINKFFASCDSCSREREFSKHI